MDERVMRAHLRSVLTAAEGRYGDGGRQECAADFWDFIVQQLGFRGFNSVSSIPHGVHEIESELHDSPCNMALGCSRSQAVNHGTDGNHQNTRINHSVEVSHKFSLKVLELPTGSSLEEHLVHLQRETPLEEPIRCEICGVAHSNSTRTHSCHSSAPLLIFHLERYIWPGPKRATDVVVPEVLQFCDRRWDLSAVVCHIGRHPSRGHYIIHVKAQRGWYHISDMDVQREDFDAVRESAARDGLLLLYRQLPIQLPIQPPIQLPIQPPIQLPIQPPIDLHPSELATREDLMIDDSHRIDLDAADPIADTCANIVFANGEEANASLPSRIVYAKVAAVKQHLRLLHGTSVSEACKAVGVSTRTYYRSVL